MLLSKLLENLIVKVNNSQFSPHVDSKVARRDVFEALPQLRNGTLHIYQAEGALDAEPRRLKVDEKPLYAHTLLDRNCAYLHE